MNKEQLKRFKSLISNTPSKWIEQAERRERLRWLTNITDVIKLKYYRLKRKLKNN